MSWQEVSPGASKKGKGKRVNTGASARQLRGQAHGGKRQLSEPGLDGEDD